MIQTCVGPQWNIPLTSKSKLNLDNILIGKFFGVYTLGLYERVYQIVMAPMLQGMQPLGAVIPQILKDLQGNEYSRLYLSFTSSALIPAAMCFALGFTMSEEIVGLILGEKWIEAAIYFKWLCVAALFQVIGISSGWVFISLYKGREAMIWGLIGSAITCSSFMIGLPWGAIGVVKAYALMMTFVQIPVLSYYLSKISPIKFKSYLALMGKAGLAFISTVFFINLGIKELQLQESSEKVILGLLFLIIAMVNYYCTPGYSGKKDLGIIINNLKRHRF